MLKSLLGQSAESRAAAFLKTQGLKLVARNWRGRFGEIDLIMRDDSTLVFIEVRLRSRSDFGGAAASVTPAKQKKLLATAHQYLATLKTLPPCRFDVVALSGDSAPDWIRNAFDDMG
ncbi:YraN family protein [Thiobacillus sp.]|uniref:YraN family protein n=1 Tax=Thiobacillus sp. TaxID=924 RepID=UPI0011D565B6|nr:YraN family protein [Thiobacillus sp.]MBD3812244.1 YraN family protein [Betaproteobacteria bacterium]MBC2729709.1 YraN family protein [Thiobacillus sp.]MBC2738444.1 YraN family protein [Thiobacillus sp.]MBC2761275.1 YraN family protein [Thiobacillus sp.]TXH74337.1 MAG: YraN family protein [Thiobacillus sp.]